MNETNYQKKKKIIWPEMAERQTLWWMKWGGAISELSWAVVTSYWDKTDWGHFQKQSVLSWLRNKTWTNI